MRDLAIEIAAQLGLRTGIKVRNMIYIWARNRETGAPEEIGIWNGDDVQDFSIGGDNRTYYGAGGFIQFDDFKQEQGLVIHQLTAKAYPFSAEMEVVLRQYDTRFARCEVHLAFYDPLTDNLLTNPYRFFKGWIDTLQIPTPVKGEAVVATINMVGQSRILTRVNPIKRSNENQKRRAPTDSFFKDVAITGTISTPWGSEGVATLATQGLAGIIANSIKILKANGKI